MPNETLQELKNYQNNLKFVYLLCYPAKALLKENITTDRIKNTKLQLDNEVIDFATIVKTIEDGNLLEELLVKIEGGFLKNLVTDSLASLKAYCKSTNQTSKLESQPWWTYFRVVKNALGHDNIWNFDGYYKRLLPVTYNGITITEELEGESMSFAYFNGHLAWHLLNDVKDFINNELD